VPTSDRYFAPDSTFWRVNREGLMVLSGPRALLLELAHPLVAAGVAGHSDFQRNPWGRLFRTVGVMTALNFQPHRQARSAVQHTRRCHARVLGTLPEDVGPYLAGTPYRADDPLLQLWVLATLIDSVLVTYDLLSPHGPLTLAAKADYYLSSLQLGRAFGLPRELMPPTYADFQCYMDSMLNSDRLTVSPQARDVAQALFAPPLFGPTVRLASFFSLGLTPPRLRAAFGFHWSDASERRLHRLARAARRLRRLAPDPLCIHPQALWAEWKLKRA
jgi:uncharacterized protein (DUF2236 family)